MKHEYKSHAIVITTWVGLNGFTTEVRISKKGPKGFQSFKLNQAFPTKAEAEAYAIDIAKRRIDNFSADPSKNIPSKMLVHDT